MKVVRYFIPCLFICLKSFSQNSPFYVWGPNLNGSTLQTAAIYSDTNYGLLFEAPKDGAGNKLNISFNWRGGGITPLFMQGSNGYVGIGTPSPSSPLEVKAANVWNGTVRANTHADGQYSSFGLFENNMLRWAMYNHPGVANTLYFANAIGEDKFAFTQEGKLGIGTTTPDYLLQLHHSNNPTLAIGKLNQNTNGKSTLLFCAGNATSQNGFLVQYLKDTSVDRLGFVGGGGTEHLSILNSGNVGIGTRIPDAKLAVKGTVHAEEVKVDLQVPGPDYVFEKNYNLRPLAEVETYINQNKHLPEVPAAKEMEANGVNLGEMNMLLLKKVEELTLYVIELKKEIVEQSEHMRETSRKK